MRIQYRLNFSNSFAISAWREFVYDYKHIKGSKTKPSKKVYFAIAPASVTEDDHSTLRETEISIDSAMMQAAWK